MLFDLIHTKINDKVCAKNIRAICKLSFPSGPVEAGRVFTCRPAQAFPKIRGKHPAQMIDQPAAPSLKPAESAVRIIFLIAILIVQLYGAGWAETRLVLTGNTLGEHAPCPT